MHTTTRLIPRRDILDLGDYERRRDEIRASAIAARQLHRVALGSNAILSFENRETLTYQIQEMLRTERIVKEDDRRETWTGPLGNDPDGLQPPLGQPDREGRPGCGRGAGRGHRGILATDGFRGKASRGGARYGRVAADPESHHFSAEPVFCPGRIS